MTSPFTYSAGPVKTLLLLYGFPLLFGLVWSVPLPVIPPAGMAANLNDYADTYNMKSHFRKTVITVQDGDLYGEVDANGNYKLLPQDAADPFKSTRSYGTIYEFRRDAQTKKVTGLTLKLMGEEVPGDKATQPVRLAAASTLLSGLFCYFPVNFFSTAMSTQ